MSDPQQIVRDFLAGWGPTADHLYDALRRYLAPDAVWENVGISTTRGPQEAIGLMKGFADAGITAVTVDEIVSIAADGNTVLTERVDLTVDAEGRIGTTPIRVMGVFEVDGDKIVAWRDYFDSAVLAQAGAS